MHMAPPLPVYYYLNKEVNDDKRRQGNKKHWRHECNDKNCRCRRKNRVNHRSNGKRKNKINGGRVFGKPTQDAASRGAFKKQAGGVQEAADKDTVQVSGPDDATKGHCKSAEDFDNPYKENLNEIGRA